MRAWLAAIGFLTRLPLPKVEMTSEDWEKSPVYYPLVGSLIGVLLFLFATIMIPVMPLLMVAALILTWWIFLTGGLHLDGWMDLADGLGSQKPREEIFVIMKDSRVGAMGVIAALLLLILKITALFELLHTIPIIYFILPPLMARFMLLIAIKAFPYKSGLGTGLKTNITTNKLVSWFFVISIIHFLILGWQGFIVVTITGLFSLLFLMWINKKLGRLNGDCYGATVELTEVLHLMVTLFIWRNVL